MSIAEMLIPLNRVCWFRSRYIWYWEVTEWHFTRKLFCQF